MSKYIDADKLIALIDAKLEDLGLSGSVWVGRSVLQELKNDIITSLQQEQPKFNIGDLVVSKNNPHLTYKILEANIPNELGKTDYKVEIFIDGKPGLIHLISSDKIEDWGELVQKEQSDVELNEHRIADIIQNLFPTDQFIESESLLLDREEAIFFARHFYELGRERKEK